MNFKVHYKERLYFSIMVIVSLVPCIFLFPLTLNIGICNLVASALFMGYLRSNAIKISEKQFPAIFEVLKSHSEKLGLCKVPDMYILQGGGILNAFAIKFMRKNFVVLLSDILEVAYQDGMDAVSFIVGHELGHIKRNHMGFMKSSLVAPAKFIPFLGSAYSRACEYTCDNIGYNLCPEGAIKGALVLAAGKKLYKKVNVNELIFNGEQNSGFATWFAEIFSSHPALIKRIAEINRLTSVDSMRDDSIFVSPKIDVKNKEKQL